MILSEAPISGTTNHSITSSTHKDTYVWRRYFFSISLIVSLFVLGVFLGLSYRNNSLILNEIQTRARTHFHNIVLTRRWNALYGGVFVEKTEDVESNPYLLNPDIHTVDGKTYTMKNPALMTREISLLAHDAGMYSFHITSMNPLNPSNAPDGFEQEALLAFEQGETERMLEQEDGEQVFFRYMAPLLVEESCMKCHAVQGYEVGQVRGGISVSFDISAVREAMSRNTQLIILLGVLTLVLLLGLFFYQTFDLMKKLKKATDRIRSMAITDHLTGVFNRRHFYTLLHRELARSRRYSTTVSCIMLDVDHFKEINDTHGHLVGDLVLREMAAVIQSNLRSMDMLARYGGEEFVILLPETNLDESWQVADKLRSLIAGHVFDTGDGQQLTVTASFGCAVFVDRGDEASLRGESFIAQADECLYRAKNEGRNQVVCRL